MGLACLEIVLRKMRRLSCCSVQTPTADLSPSGCSGRGVIFGSLNKTPVFVKICTNITNVLLLQAVVIILGKEDMYLYMTFKYFYIDIKLKVTGRFSVQLFLKGKPA